MDLSLPLQILGVIVALFFIATLVLGAKTWKWFHIMFAFLVFCAAGTFVAYAAMSLKTRSEWEKVVKKLETDVERANKEWEILQEGNPEQPDASKLEYLRGLNEELAKLYMHRGRVWRGCRLTEINAADAQLKFSTQPPPPAGVDGAAAAAAGESAANRIEEKAVLYLFKDLVVDNVHKPGEQRVVPGVFVGEVTAVRVSDADITVSPTLPLDRQQASNLVADGNTWTIYEMMPVDSHEAMRGFSEAQILAVMPNNLGLDAPTYQELVNRFARDGQPPLETDPPQNRWVRVRFLSKQSVVVDSPTTQIERESKYFDEQGQALLTVLRSGKPVEFDKGSEAILHQQKADELISAGACEKVADLYFRPLQDFPHHFHEIYTRVAYLDDRIKEVQRQTAVLLEAKEKVAKQIEYRTREKAQLEQDLANFKEEQSRIAAYRERLEATVAAKTKQLSEVRKHSMELVAQLTELQIKMAEEIDRRTLSTTSATP